MPRYLVGVVPVMLGWPTLLLPGQMALALQWAAFTGVWYIDSRVTARGWTPKWYSTYRFALSIVVGLCIILTLGATNYYQSGSIDSAAGKLANIKKQHKVKATNTDPTAGPRIEGTVTGEIATQEGDDAYVKWENEEKKREEEEKAREEEEQQQREEAEEKARQANEKATEKAEAARNKAEGRA